MILSMTAFARGQHEFDWGTLVWEIRSVNHRYLEPALRVPEALRSIEAPVRDLLRKRLGRGKIECQLRFAANASLSNRLNINQELVTQLKDAARQVIELAPESRPLSVADILRWPGALLEQDYNQQNLAEQAVALFEQTLGDLIATRRREGQELGGFVEQRLAAIREIVNELRANLPEIIERQRQVLVNRLQEVSVDLEPSRLEQEVVLLTQKADVGEELDRLEAHLNEVQRVLSVAGPKGRRLDFLMQELNREANTLSSKSIATQTTLNAVDLKVLIEQMREQIQNIE